MTLASTLLSRVAARLVLVSYLTQIIAPLAHAMETETLRRAEGFYPPAKSSFQGASPCRQEAVGCEPCPDPVSQAFGWQDFTEADYATLYQYCVEVQAAGGAGHTLSLSRKVRDPFGKLTPQFESLYTATIEGGQFTNFTEQGGASADFMLAAFREARPRVLAAGDRLIAWSWTIMGFGNIEVGVDGTVIFDQYGNPPAFSPYDLILKTSGDLHIQSLNVAGLTLQSPPDFLQRGSFCWPLANKWWHNRNQ